MRAWEFDHPSGEGEGGIIWEGAGGGRGGGVVRVWEGAPVVPQPIGDEPSPYSTLFPLESK